MTWDDVAKNWAAFSAPILQRWPDLDEDNLSRIGGDYTGFVEELGKLQNGSPEAAREQIDIWLASGIPADVIMDAHHDNVSIAQSGRSVPDGETPDDSAAAFGDANTLDNPVGRT